MPLWQPINADPTTQYAGMVVRAGAVPGEVLLAQADSEANAARVVGARVADVLAAAAGLVRPLEPGALVRMAAEPAVNDVVYLSAAAAGIGVTAAPAVEIVLGICYEKIQVGGVWFAHVSNVASPLTSYFPNPSIGGIGEGAVYENATPMGISQANTYTPFHGSGSTPTLLDGWTFVASAAGSYTGVSDAGGGKITFTGVAPGHGLVAGQIVALASSSVAGYRPPNTTIFVIDSVTATSFTVVGTFASTATGTWVRGASLVAGAGAAGKYRLFYSLTLSPAGNNKVWKIEPPQNLVHIDKAANGCILLGSGAGCVSGSGFVTVAAGDQFTLLIMNQSDTTDLTIVDAMYQLKRYSFT